MGRVTVDAERVTQPEMPAATAAAEARARSRPADALAQRPTLRGETKWFSTPPPRAISPPPPGPTSTRRTVSERAADATPESTKPASKRVSSRVAVRVDDVAGAVRLGHNALDLLRRTVPRVIRSRSEVAAAPINHREGFVLSLIDGKTSVQALIDVGGMPDEDALAILQRLRRLGIITLD